jgi:hypothetical protein
LGTNQPGTALQSNPTYEIERQADRQCSLVTKVTLINSYQNSTSTILFAYIENKYIFQHHYFKSSVSEFKTRGMKILENFHVKQKESPPKFRRQR